MTGGGCIAACGACARVGHLQAKGLCPRCYAKSRQRMTVCVDCGELRLHHRTGRCARCYRLARTRIAACGRCGQRRRIWGQVCRPCQMAARATGGPCQQCGRELARLWRGRCARCAKSHWTTGSCEHCFAWAWSIERGRCRACREFAGRNTPGVCRSCGRQIAVNRYRRCRLCTTSRREAHLAGDPHWKLEPGVRGGIQLFLGDLYHRSRAGQGGGRVPDDDNVVGIGGVTGRQLRLVAVPADPRRLPAPPPPKRVTTQIPGELAGAVAVCAEARGWKTATTNNVRQALAVLGTLGSLELTDQAVAVLRRRRLPVTRVREFLLASGFAEPICDDLEAIVNDRTGHLPARVRAEVAAWTEVLAGRWGRSRPRSPTTIRHYLNAVLPALEAWSCEFDSLREVTTDDVTAQISGLRGSDRTMTAVALRSLFAALKVRRVVFVDPARAVEAGRFPIRPVLGLDDETRYSLLDRVERPDHRLVVLLAGVHALRRSHIIDLLVDDVDLHAAVMNVAGQRRPLDPLVAEHVVAWLGVRRQRWPASANPHLLVSYKSAYGLGPVSTGYINGVFAHLPTTAAGLRADRLLAEAGTHGDPLRLARLFALSADTAVRYCAEADPALAATGRGEP